MGFLKDDVLKKVLLDAMESGDRRASIGRSWISVRFPIVNFLPLANLVDDSIGWFLHLSFHIPTTGDSGGKLDSIWG